MWESNLVLVTLYVHCNSYPLVGCIFHFTLMIFVQRVSQSISNTRLRSKEQRRDTVLRVMLQWLFLLLKCCGFWCCSMLSVRQSTRQRQLNAVPADLSWWGDSIATHPYDSVCNSWRHSRWSPPRDERNARDAPIRASRYGSIDRCGSRPFCTIAGLSWWVDSTTTQPYGSCRYGCGHSNTSIRVRPFARLTWIIYAARWGIFGSCSNQCVPVWQHEPAWLLTSCTNCTWLLTSSTNSWTFGYRLAGAGVIAPPWPTVDDMVSVH